MPIYSFRCLKHQHEFDKIFTTYNVFKTCLDDELIRCPKCGSKAEQVLAAPAKRNPDFGIQR